MRYAAIDMGTNTFHLVIGERYLNETKIIYKVNYPVRLGEKTINEGYINEEAILRATNTLKEFKLKIDELNVSKTRAVATSAVRSAKNGQQFIEKVKHEIGFEIETISGDEEATLIYNAVKSSGSIEGTVLIMDIGGGSTEFIIANAENILWKKSYDLGASRLWQKHFYADPLSKDDRLKLRTLISNLLVDLFAKCNEYQPSLLIGSAGAFETYLTMLNPSNELSSAFEDIHLVAFNNLSCLLNNSTHEERSKMKGLIPLRVDMIVAASFLTKLVLDETGIQNIRMTTYDLKMGLLETVKVSI